MSAKDIWTAKMTYKRKSLEDTFKRFFYIKRLSGGIAYRINLAQPY